MLKNQRHREIIEILKAEGFAEVKDLEKRLYASQPTIRRDLTFLEKQGFVKRSHGGAIIADDKNNTPLPFRKGTKAKEKARICKLAATLITPGSLIFVDGSSTASHIADHIQKKDNVTVVTNGYPICSVLSESDVQVFSTGGRLLKNSMAFVGRHAEEALGKFNADVMFFSSSSFSDDGIISDYSEEETALRIKMRQGAKKAVFLCDSSKFGKCSAFRVFSMDEIDYIVSDEELSDGLLSSCGYRKSTSENDTYLYERIK